MDLQIGQKIDDYRLVDVIAQGAYANVYKASMRSKRFVAIKILHKAFVDPDQEHDAVYQEADILERLKHPNILAVVDFGMYQEWPYIVKEYAPNGSLRDYLRSLHGSPLSINEFIYIIRQIGAGLQFAHDHKVVHCDLKPENILFDDQNALISDFDIARVLESSNSYQRGIGGTPSYMAPEQFQGKVRYESDQYALGCMAYEMVTGKRPFEGDSPEALRYNHFNLDPVPPTQLRPDLPIHIEQAILRAMEKHYQQRFPDVASFVDALDPVQAAPILDSWSQVMPQSGPKLILHQHGKRKEAEDESIFYEDTVSMYAESTEVDIKPVRHRTPKATPKTTDPKKPTTAKKTTAKTATAKKATAKTATTAKKPITAKKPPARKTTTTAKTATTAKKSTAATAKKTTVKKKLPARAPKK